MKSIRKFSILLVALFCIFFSFNNSYASMHKVNSTTSGAFTSKTISKGTSYEFFNKSKKTGSIKIVGNLKADYDYVVYDKKKAVVTSQIVQWVDRTITVPAGGKAVITVQSKTSIKAGGPKNVFQGKASKTPAFVRSTITKGKSYELVNTSKQTGAVKIVGNLKADYDYVVYDKKKAVVTSQIVQWVDRTITVPAGGKVVITVQSKTSIKAGGPKNLFQGKASKTPAFVRSTITKGKSYELVNTSKQTGTVKIVGDLKSDYDYVVYDKKKAVVTSQIVQWVDRTITVPAGGKVVITVQSKTSIKAGGSKNLFQGKVSKTPAFVRSTIAKGKSYEFINTSKQTGAVKIVGDLKADYDYVVYDKKKAVVTSQIVQWVDRTITVPAGGKVVITVQSKASIKAGGPKNLFQGKVSKTPAFVRSTITKGKTYQLINTSKQTGAVKIVGDLKADYNYVVYDKKKAVITSGLAQWVDRTITVPAGGKVVITVKSKQSIIAGGPKLLFVGK
ncbi:hypothetical protein [Heyndrickxia vini]|uniref:Uncharacterized protein n=1 Tax=Heyndrickxia vini TaxID=1476025 RepID=A0ABX7DYW2_9BACI|nr:hypothetical protein [Heyndrickxia vini]QQZ08658.1 hypothetical protein I5776_16710 [Heyndrickxia vini]